METIRREYGAPLARWALELGAISLSPKKPFRWASGYYMPMYNDNRRLLAAAKVRSLIAQGFVAMAETLKVEVQQIAGTATAGIPHATTLADALQLPLSYVRSGGKEHGLGNLIEGLGAERSYQGASVLLIEDLISTGGSSIKAVQAIRAADGLVPYCFAIFSYGLVASEQAFAALEPPCQVATILDYALLLEVALEEEKIDQEEFALLTEWKQDPFGWGEQNGFPPER
jgi:orotate phosphoribosyltransferase